MRRRRCCVAAPCGRRTGARWSPGRSAFLRAYLQQMEGSPLLPRPREQVSRLLDVLLLEKIVYELGYELNNRPEWVQIPLRGVLRTLGA
jgi:maltose alpha-D-glucosyltransferase / alpha-amylase